MRMTSRHARSRPRRARSRPWPRPRSTCTRHRHALPGQGQPVRAAVGAACQDLAPGDRRLVGVGGTDHVQARDGAQRGQVLDRLVGRAVLAEADGVVRPHVRHRQLHQRGQPHGVAHVVGEHQERAAVDAGVAVQRDAVHGRAHGVLADAEVHRAAVRARPPEPGAVPLGRKEDAFRSWCCCSPARSAEPPHSSGITGRAPSAPCRRPRGWRRLCRAPRTAAPPPSPSGSCRRGQPVERGALGLRAATSSNVFSHSACASWPRSTASRACASTVVVDLEGLLGVEAQHLLGRGDLVVAQRRAVRGRCSARSAPARR